MAYDDQVDSRGRECFERGGRLLRGEDGDGGGGRSYALLDSSGAGIWEDVGHAIKRRCN